MADSSGRSPALLPAWLRASIERDRIAVEVVSHAEAAHTAEAAARILRVSVSDIVKTLVLTDGAGCWVAAIVPGDRRVDRAKVAASVGAKRLRFASAEEVLAHTGYPAGGVAPLAFANPLSVVVDASLTTPVDRTVVAGGGRPELLIRIAVRTIVDHNGAQVSTIADPPASPHPSA
jgi:Cys-tRNA(Pro)/Cys-tRNA(Cys) deacylase